MTDRYLKSLLGERERVLIVTRQHWFVLFRKIIFEIAAIALILIATMVIAISVSQFIVMLAVIIAVVPIGFMVADILVWRSHQFVVTNRRIIQISGVINKKVVDSSLEKVNDVKMTQSFWGRTFNFGTIEILTASELGVNVFKYMSNPMNFKTSMLNAKESLAFGAGEVPLRGPDASSGGIPQLIAELDLLRRQGVLTEEEFQQKKTELLAKM